MNILDKLNLLSSNTSTNLMLICKLTIGSLILLSQYHDILYNYI